MGELIAKLLSGLGAILRYIAPGFVALLVAIWVDKCFEPFKTAGYGAILVGASLAGFFIYSIHTGFLVRPLWCLIVLLHKKCKHLECLNECSQLYEEDKEESAWKIMWELDTQRWKRRGSGDKKIKAVQRELDKWSELLNFLYCSGYATIFVPILIKCFRSEHTEEYWLKVAAFGVVILVFALISEWRETNRELWTSKWYRNAKHHNEPQKLIANTESNTAN
jgi:hypothetical protein